MNSEDKKYLDESKENFLDRMKSQSPKKLSDEEKQRADEFNKEVEAYREKLNESNERETN